MSTTEIVQRIETPSSARGKSVVGYYVLTILTGAFVLFFHGRSAFVVDLVAGVFYLVVTAFLYALSKPVKRAKD